MGFETTEEILAEELEKQRRKLHNITSTLDQQHQMLRLIVQVCYYLSRTLFPFGSNLIIVIQLLISIGSSENGNKN